MSPLLGAASEGQRDGGGRETAWDRVTEEALPTYVLEQLLMYRLGIFRVFRSSQFLESNGVFEDQWAIPLALGASTQEVQQF